MIIDLIQKELDKREALAEKVRGSFHRHFTITNRKKDKIRKYIVQNIILEDVGLLFNPQNIQLINRIIKSEGIVVVNGQGYRSFRGLVERTTI
jgi:hypothetical protein